jgi:hypothetical protein
MFNSSNTLAPGWSMKRAIRDTLALALVLLASAAAMAKTKDKDATAEWKPPDPAGWVEARSENFTLYSNAGEDRTRKVAIQLELFRKALARITKGLVLDARVPTTTFVFKNEAALTPYRNDREGRPMNVSGYFMPSPFGNFIALDATAGDSPIRVVYHEYFHAVMEASLGDLPLWLNEGLAEYYSTFRSRDSLRKIEIGHPITEHLALLAERGTLPWSNVFETTADSPNYNEESRQGQFYAQSWLIVHFLASTDERTKALGKYLTLLRDGTEPDQAMSSALGFDRAGLAAAVEAYRQTGSGHVAWELPEKEAAVTVTLRPLEPAELWLGLGALLAHGGPRNDAARHLEAARAAGAPAPAVDSLLGVAAMGAKDEPAAEVSLRRAVAGGGVTTEAAVLLAGVLLDRGFKRASEGGGGRTSTPAEFLEARTLLSAALEREPQCFPALLDLAQTYVVEADTAPGVAALVRARKLRPLEVDLAVQHACLLAAGGHPAEAWPLVERIVAPRSKEAAHRAASCVADGTFRSARFRLEAGDRAAAQAIVTQAVDSISDPALRSPLVQFQQVLAQGREIYFYNDAPKEHATLERFNEAVGLANAGNLDGALERLDLLAKECAGGPLCERAVKLTAELRSRIAAKRIQARYNEAVDLANRGKRKEAIAALRALEQETTDPEALQHIRLLLGDLGAKDKR